MIKTRPRLFTSLFAPATQRHSLPKPPKAHAALIFQPPRGFSSSDQPPIHLSPRRAAAPALPSLGWFPLPWDGDEPGFGSPPIAEPPGTPGPAPAPAERPRPGPAASSRPGVAAPQPPGAAPSRCSSLRSPNRLRIPPSAAGRSWYYFIIIIILRNLFPAQLSPDGP